MYFPSKLLEQEFIEENLGEINYRHICYLYNYLFIWLTETLIVIRRVDLNNLFGSLYHFVI